MREEFNAGSKTASAAEDHGGNTGGDGGDVL
jgi:hypothetical protein